MTQALFANQREANLHSTVSLVEEVLTELGHDPAASRITEHSALHAWSVRKGSAITRITLINRAEFTHIRICAVVMTLDAKVDRAELHRHLLDLNAGLCSAAFATDGDHVLMLSERSTLDLDVGEIRELVKRVTTYADDHDDVLVARFGGTMGDAAAR